jgi:hypothetical protein
VVMQTDNSLCQGAVQVVTEHGFRAGPGLESWLHHLPAGWPWEMASLPSASFPLLWHRDNSSTHILEVRDNMKYHRTTQSLMLGAHTKRASYYYWYYDVTFPFQESTTPASPPTSFHILNRVEENLSAIYYEILHLLPYSSSSSKWALKQIDPRHCNSFIITQALGTGKEILCLGVDRALRTQRQDSRGQPRKPGCMWGGHHLFSTTAEIAWALSSENQKADAAVKKNK